MRPGPPAPWCSGALHLLAKLAPSRKQEPTTPPPATAPHTKGPTPAAAALILDPMWLSAAKISMSAVKVMATRQERGKVSRLGDARRGRGRGRMEGDGTRPGVRACLRARCTCGGARLLPKSGRGVLPP